MEIKVGIGQVFGSWTVISGPKSSKDKHVLYECKCDCGTTQMVRRGNLVRGKSVCCRNCSVKKNPRYHGKSRIGNKLYGLWNTIKTRCNNPRREKYRRYGGRGIKICPEWENDFVAFEKWALGQKGSEKPFCQIDRIDNDGPYSPENCRFVSNSVNSHNRSTTRLVTAFGETKCLVEWERDDRCVVARKTIYNRLQAGWTPERAISGHRLKG